MSSQEFIEQVLRLPAADHAEVAAEILFSLSPDESLDVDEREWIAEIQSRREEASRGAVVMRPWSDVRVDLLTMLAQRADPQIRSD